MGTSSSLAKMTTPLRMGNKFPGYGTGALGKDTQGFAVPEHVGRRLHGLNEAAGRVHRNDPQGLNKGADYRQFEVKGGAQKKEIFAPGLGASPKIAKSHP